MKAMIIALTCLLLSCNNSSPDLENAENASPVEKVQYVFIATVVSRPVFHGRELYGFHEPGTNEPSFTMEYAGTNSTIMRVVNLTEDEKYRMIDAWEEKILKETDEEYGKAVKDNFLDTQRTEQFLKVRASIDTSVMKEFDSYKEASLFLKKLKKI